MKELADRIVALGVGGCSDLGYADKIPYDYRGQFLTEEQFTHSWEVAGALMEKCADADMEMVYGGGFDYWCVPAWDEMAFEYHDESLPHAIIQACVEALEEAPQ